MNIALWTAAVLVAATMLLGGIVKLVVPHEKIVKKMRWAGRWTRVRIKLLGLAEVLGGIGLIVPQLTGVVPMLTPIAALCVAILMLGAVKAHLELRESMLVLPAVVVLLAVFVALGRFGVLA